MNLPKFRAATAEEIEKIKGSADLGPGCSVLAFDGGQGDPDFVVLRQCWEADPVIYADSSNHRRKALMLSILENMLAFSGVPQYYFNISASEEFSKQREVMKSWGAEQVSPTPEFRFKKSLVDEQKDRN